MILISVNGMTKEFGTTVTLSELINQLNISMTGTAVAVNGRVIPSEGFSLEEIKDGDRVEIIRAIGGG